MFQLNTTTLPTLSLASIPWRFEPSTGCPNVSWRRYTRRCPRADPRPARRPGRGPRTRPASRTARARRLVVVGDRHDALDGSSCDEPDAGSDPRRFDPCGCFVERFERDLGVARSGTELSLPSGAALTCGFTAARRGVVPFRSGALDGAVVLLTSATRWSRLAVPRPDGRAPRPLTAPAFHS